MPRLNSRGVASTGFCTTWYDEERYIVTDQSNGDLRVLLSDGTELAGPTVTSSRYAGAGKWVAEVPGGVLWEGLTVPGAALAGYCDPIGPDGSLVVKRVRDSFGPWGFVKGADFGGDCKIVTNYGSGRASWIEGDWAFHTNFGSKWSGTRCYNYRLKGDDFLYQSAITGELVLNGKVIGGPGNYYRPDLRRVGDNFQVVWSVVEGEPTVTERIITMGELAGMPDWKPVRGVVVPVQPPPPVEEKPKVSDAVDRKPEVDAVVGSGLKPDGTPEGNFAFISKVLKTIRERHPTDKVGFVASSAGGDNTIAYGTGFVRTSRLIYANGHLYKLITDAGPGGANGPAWNDEGLTDPGKFVAPIQEVPPAQQPPPPAQVPSGPTIEEVKALISAAIGQVIVGVQQALEAQKNLIDEIDNDLHQAESQLEGLKKALTDGIRSQPAGYGPLKHSHMVKL